MVINSIIQEGNKVKLAVKGVILDILSELTGIESKKQLIHLLTTTKPHKVDNHRIICYSLPNGKKRKIDIGYYNSAILEDNEEIISILSHLWRLAINNMLLSLDISVGNLIAVYKISECIYCSYNIVETERKEIRVTENIANYQLQ